MEVPGVRAALGPRVPRQGRDLLRRQDRHHRRRAAVHVPRLRGAHASARERARGLGIGAGRSRLVHHVQHASPPRGVLRRPRGGGGAEPDQHPAHAARDRLHPGPRRLEARRLPPRLPAARRGDRPAAHHATSLRDPRGRARRHRQRRVRGAPVGWLTRAAPPADRRERDRGALLHERDDRPAQGRRAYPPRALPPLRPRGDRARVRRGGRDPPRGPALPRQRLGRPPFPDHGRRPPRDAPPLRPRRRSWSSSSATA